MPESRTTDPEEFVFWVVRWVSERTSLSLHPPERPDFRGPSWATQPQLLKDLDTGWPGAWLSATRTALSVAGADDMLPPRS
ncbi:hypothetical protein P3H15_47410 [Rhodococcus sp. T2V]|uniref:hypothetical protein n=1 Tax=Rhodococcus sp. T2V TaxID=3034164 RepID=UPI0023E33694|nr:hypothetical protein [Rhodococcus sp. T2V]MDF3312578.1 hypothetical protein [Rhodococcus sp. T2V]